MCYLSPIWSRWIIPRSERPICSRCPISRRVSADLKSMNYSPVWTADSKSMSYFLARMVDRDLMTPGYTDQWYWSMHISVLFHWCIFVLAYWAVWWRNLCAYKYVYVVGWRFLHNRELNCVCYIQSVFQSIVYYLLGGYFVHETQTITNFCSINTMY